MPPSWTSVSGYEKFKVAKEMNGFPFGNLVHTYRVERHVCIRVIYDHLKSQENGITLKHFFKVIRSSKLKALNM